MALKLLICWALLVVTASAQTRDWEKVGSFAYQLQNVDLKLLSRSRFDLLVIDYSQDGSDAKRWTRAQLASLKPRLVLSYLSIGEAEDYRFYWKPYFRPRRPLWLEGRNPEWKGHYKVRYWDPGWQKLIYQYLDDIMEAGFDGVYLDLIDAYEYFEERNRSGARREMRQFVADIARYCRARAGDDFGIFAQNGDDLLQDPRYLQVLTGIGREDTYFGHSGFGKASPAAWTRQVENNLKLARRQGKLVLNVDYTWNFQDALKAHRRARQLGFLEYTGPRELDRIWFIPGLQP